MNDRYNFWYWLTFSIIVFIADLLANFTIKYLEYKGLLFKKRLQLNNFVVTDSKLDSTNDTPIKISLPKDQKGLNLNDNYFK